MQESYPISAWQKNYFSIHYNRVRDTFLKIWALQPIHKRTKIFDQGKINLMSNCGYRFTIYNKSPHPKGGSRCQHHWQHMYK